MHITEEEFVRSTEFNTQNLTEDARKELNPFNTLSPEEADQLIDNAETAGSVTVLLGKIAYLQFQNMGPDEIAARAIVLEHILKGYEFVFNNYNISDVTREKLNVEYDQAVRKYKVYKARLE